MVKSGIVTESCLSASFVPFSLFNTLIQFANDLIKILLRKIEHGILMKIQD